MRLAWLALVGLAAFLAAAGEARAAVPGAWEEPPVYNDGWTGWPVAPVDRQHPIRASFHDPRPGDAPAGEPGYHIGVDIAVRDDRPDPAAPPARAHRVYALERGVVATPADDARSGCSDRRVTIGHFSYWHVDSVGVVEPGQAVEAGQHIGWTCASLWHMHLSEWQLVGGRQAWVNPLRRGGKLAPYEDVAPPVIDELALVAPATPAWSLTDRAVWAPPAGTALDPNALAGLVDLRARVRDPQSFDGWFADLPRLRADHRPHRVRVEIVRLADGALVHADDAFRDDTFLGLAFSAHYAPGTRQNLPAAACLARRTGSCAGVYWLRLMARPGSPYWDTSTVANGRYRIVVTAYDTAGGQSPASSLDVTVANPPPAVVSEPPIVVGETEAALAGDMPRADTRTRYAFEWGPTTAYGSRTPARQADGPGPVAEAVVGLRPGTSYHYRLVAWNEAGQAIGADQEFRTPADDTPPVLLAPAALRGRLRPVLARGVRAPLRCDEACTVALTLRLPAALARRLRVPPVVARRVVRLSSTRETLVGIVVPARPRRALRGVRRLDATLLAVARDAAGNETRTAITVTLRR